MELDEDTSFQKSMKVQHHPCFKDWTPGRKAYFDWMYKTCQPITFQSGRDFRAENALPREHPDAPGRDSKRWKRYREYEHCTTIHEARENGARMSDIKQDFCMGRIMIDERLSASSRNHNRISLLSFIGCEDANEFKEKTRKARAFLTKVDEGLRRPRFEVGSRINIPRRNLSGTIKKYIDESGLYVVAFNNQLSLEIDPIHIVPDEEDKRGVRAYAESIGDPADREDEVVRLLKQRIELLEKVKGVKGNPISNMENSDLTYIQLENLMIMGERAFETYANEIYTPRNFRDASKCNEKEEWNDSMFKEIDSLIKLKTFEVVHRSHAKNAGKKVMRAGFVYKVKCDENGFATVKKSRWVARGYQQVEGSDWFESFSTVTDFTTVRTMIALAAQSGDILSSVDIKNAFLTAALEPDEYVYLQLPDNWRDPRFGDFFRRAHNGEDVVLLCTRSLYGLHQCSRTFGALLRKNLNEIGLRSTVQDDCLYTMDHAEHGTIRLSTWVDDLLISTKTDAGAQWLTTELAKYFTLSSGAGERVRHFLGLRIDRKGNYIKISNETAIRNLIKDMDKYLDRSEGYAVDTPCYLDKPLQKNEGTKISEEEFPYRKVVGVCLHLSRSYRCDISYCVSELSRHLGNTSVEHIEAAKRLLYYLRSTADLGLVYRPHTGKNRTLAYRLVLMSDSDWAGCVSTRQSRSGNCAILSNCVIDYYSKMQGLISSSSCEAETEAAVQGMKTLVHLRILLHELGYFQRGSTKLYGDNMATVLNSNSRKQSPRSKAFQIRTELLRAVTRRPSRSC